MLLVAFVVNVAIAYGLMPPLWYAPEAQILSIQTETTGLAMKMTGIANDVDMTLKLDLGKEMRDNQLNRCAATTSGARLNLSNILDMEQQYYYKRFGTYYQLPNCDQL